LLVALGEPLTAQKGHVVTPSPIDQFDQSLANYG
jgi:hypothetical protein